MTFTFIFAIILMAISRILGDSDHFDYVMKDRELIHQEYSIYTTVNVSFHANGNNYENTLKASSKDECLANFKDWSSDNSTGSRVMNVHVNIMRKYTMNYSINFQQLLFYTFHWISTIGRKKAICYMPNANLQFDGHQITLEQASHAKLLLQAILHEFCVEQYWNSAVDLITRNASCLVSVENISPQGPKGATIPNDVFSKESRSHLFRMISDGGLAATGYQQPKDRASYKNIVIYTRMDGKWRRFTIFLFVITSSTI